MNTGERIEIEISDMTADGRGIGRSGGLAVFVDGNEAFRPVPGDKVTAEVSRIRRGHAQAMALDMVTPSPDRAPPFCGHAGQCGGCALQELRYGSQLLLKERQLRDRLRRIAGLRSPKVLAVTGMESPFRFRNKAQMPVGPEGAGFYRERSRSVVDCIRCPVCAEPAEALLSALRRYMGGSEATAYSHETGTGLIRHLVVRVAERTGEVMAVLVANGDDVPHRSALIEAMRAAVNGLLGGNGNVTYSLESVALNCNRSRGAEVLGGEFRLLAGKPVITDLIESLRVEMSPASFYQVNPRQASALYGSVLRYAALTGGERVLDVCCGAGVMGLLCAAHANEVIGFEMSREAVADGERNAAINSALNMRFICGKAEKTLPELAASGMTADVAILDPPRSGCMPGALKAVVRMKPERVVYVSCDSATLARDVRALSEMGYVFREAAPVDMFPHTMHLETVALLTRGSGQPAQGGV